MRKSLVTTKPERWSRVVAALVFAAAAVVTVRASTSMSGGMRMPGGWTMTMMWMAMPGQTMARSAWVFLVMWQAMMIAMMLPSCWPMLELYQRVAISTGQKRPALGTAIAGAGYFGIWLVFGAVAFAAGLGLSHVAMASARISRMVPAAGGAGLILAGAYQLSPIKQTCLRHCRSPLIWLGEAWRPGLSGAARIGIHHGAFCTACCWALMLIQFILGMMNLGVTLAIAAAIGLEKLWRRGPVLARIFGAGAVICGAYLLISAVLGKHAG